MGARNIPNFLLKRRIVIQRGMGCRVGLHVADIAIRFCHAARGDERHVGEPVGQRTAEVFGASAIAVDGDAKESAGEMFRIGPALELERFGLLGDLAMRRRWIGIPAIGSHEAVDHGLERRRCLVPMHGCDDHDPMRSDPHWVDLIHPVIGLAEGVIGIATAGPVAESHRGCHAGFAGMNGLAKLRCDPGKIEPIDRKFH